MSSTLPSYNRVVTILPHTKLSLSHSPPRSAPPATRRTRPRALPQREIRCERHPRLCLTPHATAIVSVSVVVSVLHLWQLLLARSQPLPDIIVGNRAVVSTRRRVSRTHSGVESRGIAESWGGDAVRAARFSHCFHARPRPQSQIDRVHGQTEMRSRQRYRVRAAQMYIISLPGLLVHSATCTPLPLPLPCQPKCFTTSSTSREQDTV